MVAIVFFGSDRREDVTLTDRLAAAAKNAGDASRARMRKMLGKENGEQDVEQEKGLDN